MSLKSASPATAANDNPLALVLLPDPPAEGASPEPDVAPDPLADAPFVPDVGPDPPPDAPLVPDVAPESPLDPDAPPLELAPARDSLLALDPPAPEPLPPPPQPASTTTAEAAKTAQIQRRDPFFLQTINPHPPYRLSGGHANANHSYSQPDYSSGVTFRDWSGNPLHIPQRSILWDISRQPATSSRPPRPAQRTPAGAARVPVFPAGSGASHFLAPPPTPPRPPRACEPISNAPAWAGPTWSGAQPPTA